MVSEKCGWTESELRTLPFLRNSAYPYASNCCLRHGTNCNRSLRVAYYRREIHRLLNLCRAESRLIRFNTWLSNFSAGYRSLTLFISASSLSLPGWTARVAVPGKYLGNQISSRTPARRPGTRTSKRPERRSSKVLR